MKDIALEFIKIIEDNGFVASYTHMGGKIGVLVDIQSDVVNDAVKEMAKNVEAAQASWIKMTLQGLEI